jgi:putative SOS response-associated peptidase YedK
MSHEQPPTNVPASGYAKQITSKPSWRSAYRKHRCVIPSAGYYEWQPEERDGKVVKQPFYIHPVTRDGVLSFAGLYEWWPDPSKDKDDPDRWLWSAVIITTDATGPAGEIHDRTPLILPRDRVDAWLDPHLTDPGKIADMLQGVQAPPMQIRAVSREVNRVGPNGPQLIEPLPDEADQPLQLALAA